MASPGQNRYGYHRANTYSNRPERRTWDNLGYPMDSSQRTRAEGESWVEISSQPSSSSLSSIDNEIITTGLRVQPLDLRRHRRYTTLGTANTPHAAARAIGRSASSQDEYDASSSEDEDRVLAGTADSIHLRARNGGRLSPRQQMAGLDGLVAESVRFPPPSVEDEDDDEDDEDEEGTALGIRDPDAMFTSQPRNVGSTPRGTYREAQGDGYFPPSSHAQRFGQTAHRAANDAALRASLTTLLSCAQAARSLPKPYTGTSAATRGGNDMQEFRVLPESEVVGATATSAPPNQTQISPRLSTGTRPRSSAAASADEKEKGKEKRRSGTSLAKAGKKKRAGTHVHSTNNGAEVHQVLTQTVSPTLLTWIVSAGVVVFVSVVGFGAGYAMGFEAGKEESKLLDCGREVPIKVRRFRWGTAA